MTARQPWVSQIRNARNTAEQIVVLKALKNELIGHPPKKETAVAAGVLDPIVRLSLNRTASRNDGKSHDYSFASRPLSEEEVARLQGVQVIASIALGRATPQYFHAEVNQDYRWPTVSGSSSLFLRSASHSFEPLSIKQSFTASAGFNSGFIKYCRFLRIGISQLSSKYNYSCRSPLL